MADSSRSILARLEQLKQWQEEQQRVLLQKQVIQRELLQQEQKKMYTILGIGSGEDDDTEEALEPSGQQEVLVVSDDDEEDREYEETNMQRQLATERRWKQKQQRAAQQSDDEADVREEARRKVPTKPFLKRGQGLKARFKVDPNVFKLDNLPKYKYANNAKSRAQKVKQTRPEVEKSKPPPEERRKSEEKPRKASKEDSPLQVALDINKVSDKKLVVPVAEGTSRSLSRDNSKTEEAQLVISDSEDSLLPSIESLKLRHAAGSELEKVPVLPQPPIHPDLPWKQQLQEDPALLRQLKEIKDLNLFELLEQKLSSANGSLLSSDASALLRMLAENSVDLSGVLGLSDSTIIPPISHPAAAEPLVQPEDVSCIKIHPIPDSKRHFLKDEHSDSSDDSGTSESESEEADEGNAIHVRFADQEEQDNETDLESQLETVNYSRMSTPKEKRDRRSVEADEELPSSQEKDDDEQRRIREDILEKSELLKKRLTELETEIESFRKENAELTRMKQDHELDKIKLEQDREEMMEKLNDERIKMEVYFHDERMKIEDERQKVLKEAMKPTKKEKEEILRLKEQIAELQKEAKAKEAKHASSLARFRSQIKTLEKDLKETQLELEVTKKDNKKLETENARLKRQNNSRMLLEINKNLAKLAAPQTEASSGDSRRNSSPEKPRKSSHPVKMKPIEVVEKNVIGKVGKAKVISHPREGGKPAHTMHLSSSESESEQEAAVQNSSSDSSQESSAEGAERSKSSYFQSKAKKELFQPELKETKKQPQFVNRSPETAQLIKNLKREVVNEDGSRDIWYPNGNLKKISPDGLVMRMLFFNKDIKETNLNEGTTKYYYYETNIWHTTYLDGLEILEYPDGQTEHRFKDGSTEVHFPNGSIRTTNPNSVDIAEEWKYVDGSSVIIKKNGDKVINLPNGQVEIHTKAHKRRIYPDGTVKFLYPDGSQESRYSNGRVRLKDKDGRLVSDTGGTTQ